MAQTERKPYYDIARIQDIPILEVCQQLGIPVQQKGGKPWCKLREERTASTILHPENNTFHDFGANWHGDAIDLVSDVRGVSKGDAIRFLAEVFHISPETPDRNGNGLSDWEYRQIGIAGDLATKNFDFDLEHQGVESVMQLSQCYGIPMNDLRQRYPKVYEQLLRQKAVPFVKALRDDYYLEVFSRYSLAKGIGAEHVFQSGQAQAEFSQKIAQLQRAEGTLLRACQRTSIRAYPVGSYEPESDLNKILNGDIKIPLGERSYWDMNQLAREQGTTVKYRSVDYGKYLSGNLEAFQHSAFLKKDAVVVGFLETDYTRIKPVLDSMRPNTLEALTAKVREQMADINTKTQTSFRTVERDLVR